MGNNWENFLKNLGEWQGSFTKVSLDGELLNSTPSIISLEGLDDNRLVRFRLRRFGTGGYDEPPTQDYQQDYTSLGRQIIFFDSGAFSKGSLQLAPFAEFGAEYGFVIENRRLRFVQLYDNQGNLNSLTLIREFRSDSDGYERPVLTISQLVGKWKGEACTAYADWREAQTYATSLEIRELGDGLLQQQLSFGERTINSNARIDGNRLHFEDGSLPRTILLLADGVSSNVPLQVKLGQEFFLEVGWLVSPTQRQRVIRSYNDRGQWINSTHVIEEKIS
jgi:hypothetical protein